MADTERDDEPESTESANGHGGTKTAVRAAAIAAASGATALAARKAFSSSGKSSSGGERGGRSGGDDSVLSSAFASAWDSARGSLVPAIEEAAGHAGEWVARNAPEVVRETLVPRFIKGFQRAHDSGDDD
jgi:hypothetical protein